MNRQRIKSNWQNTNAHMFKEDFAYHLVYSLSTAASSDFFAINENSDDKLKDKIKIEGSHSLNSGLIDIIHSSVTEMLMFGETFIGFADKKNDGKINIFNIPHDKCKSWNKKYTFIRYLNNNIQNKQSLKITNSYKKNEVIHLYFSNIGITNRQRKLIEKKLSNIDFTRTTKLHIEKKVNYDLEQYKKLEILEILKSTYGLKWNGRRTNLEEINEYYTIYRLAKFKLAQIKMLEYIIGSINEKISSMFDNSTDNYFTYNILLEQNINNMLVKMEKGEMAFSEALDLLFPKLKRVNQ